MNEIPILKQPKDIFREGISPLTSQKDRHAVETIQKQLPKVEFERICELHRHAFGISSENNFRNQIKKIQQFNRVPPLANNNLGLEFLLGKDDEISNTFLHNNYEFDRLHDFSIPFEQRLECKI